MNVLCINSSPRKNGNISLLCRKILKGAELKGHQTEMIYLYDYNISPCIGCWSCAKNQKCHIQDDFEMLYSKIEQAERIILGVPNYWCNLPGVLVNFIDRHTGYAIWKPKDGRNFGKLPSIRSKIKMMLKCFRNFGPINPSFQKKQFILVIAGTSPFRYLLGEYKGILFMLRKYVQKLNGKIKKTIIYTDTLFRLRKNKESKLLKKAFSIGTSL